MSLERLARHGSTSASARHAADYQVKTVILLGSEDGHTMHRSSLNAPFMKSSADSPSRETSDKHKQTKERKRTAQRFNVQNYNTPHASSAGFQGREPGRVLAASHEGHVESHPCDTDSNCFSDDNSAEHAYGVRLCALNILQR